MMFSIIIFLIVIVMCEYTSSTWKNIKFDFFLGRWGGGVGAGWVEAGAIVCAFIKKRSVDFSCAHCC
jgi:hypothetical protein